MYRWDQPPRLLLQDPPGSRQPHHFTTGGGINTRSSTSTLSPPTRPCMCKYKPRTMPPTLRYIKTINCSLRGSDWIKHRVLWCPEVWLRTLHHACQMTIISQRCWTPWPGEWCWSSQMFSCNYLGCPLLSTLWSNLCVFICMGPIIRGVHLFNSEVPPFGL